MNAEDFCWWLQGFIDLDGSEPTDEQWQTIKAHVKVILKKDKLSSFNPYMLGPVYEPRIPKPTKITCSNGQTFVTASFATAEDFKNRGH